VTLITRGLATDMVEKSGFWSNGFSATAYDNDQVREEGLWNIFP
jgi:hypothetical protein